MSESLINVRPLGKFILVDIYDDGEETVDLGNGVKFIMLNDTNFGRDRDLSQETHPGIRPRWAKVVATPDDDQETGLAVGMKVLLDTMKWSRGVYYDGDKKVWRIPIEDVLGIDEGGFDEEEVTHMESRYGS